MFNPKKVIPTLATGALALAGCGGDDGGGLTGALNSWCMKLAGCFPQYYSNAQECVNYFLEYRDDVLEYYGLSEIPADCEAAVTSYLNCGAALTCEELNMFSNDCDDELYAGIEACIPLRPS